MSGSVSSAAAAGAEEAQKAAKPADPMLSATVIICRECEDRSYKILFVKRHDKARFMPNFHVFPGGILEKSDFDPRWRQLLSLPASATDSVSFPFFGSE